ncbi:HAD hydrolase-like protein [Lentzea sp. NPDC058450]|uniref:HAD hydrolase-like protein n=1 Tax=Lentzea sp. NPDC058450 TaxID=3346505 RepID=UPI003669F2F3
MIEEVLRQHDIETTADARRLLSTALSTSFEDRRAELPGHGEVLPGALRALEHFANDPRVHQAVLTANLASVAQIKLEEFGLAHLVDWDASAFGDDHLDRADLVTVARDRARHVRPFADEEVVVIGDTPHDVYAATKAGVRLIAVATGRSSRQDLHRAGAQIVIDDLSDLELLIRSVHAR